MLVIKKALMALLTTTSVATTSVVPTLLEKDSKKENPYHQKDDEMLTKQMIHNNIDRDSVYLKTDTKYHYKNQEYKQRDTIVNKFLEQNPIIAEKTSSNPNKIIRDYEYQELDEKRVYGTDPKDYVKVYKNALGKVVLPTCATSTADQKGCVVSDKTTEQRALDSYVNAGLIRQKYTYAFGGSQNWYDSPTEAEIAYTKSHFNVKQSLFYFYNGQYYNAFSKSGFEILKQTQLNAGYYFDAEAVEDENKEKTKEEKEKEDEEYCKEDENKTDNSKAKNTVDSDFDPNKQIKTFWDTNVNFEEKLKQGLARIFRANLNTKLINYETPIAIEIKTPEGEWISDFKSTNENISYDEKSHLLTIKNLLRNGGVDITQLLNDLHDTSSSHWSKEMVGTKWCDDYERHIYSNSLKLNDNEKGEKEISFSFHLNTEGDGCSSGYQETHPAKIETRLVEEKMKDDIKLNSKTVTSSLLLNKIMKLTSSFSPKWSIKQIADNIDLYGSGKANKIMLSIYKKMNPTNWDQRFTDKMFEIYYECIKAKLYDEQYELVHKDWTYGTRSNPVQFSVYESNKKYKKCILNKKIVNKTGNDDEQITRTRSAAGYFTTSWANWRDNFYYLDQNNLQQMPLKLMYYVDTNESNDISEFSGLTGQTIASSKDKAQKIAFMNAEKILRKQHFIYDINGQITISASDEQAAIEKLRNKVNLDYTYININEAKQIKDQDLNWKDIISDGLYTVYKFKSSTGSWLYFMSFDSAYKQFQNQVGLIAGIAQETITYYRYVLNYNGQKYIFDWSNDQEIDDTVKKIYQIIKK